MDHKDWPALPYKDWAATKRTLHMILQIVGKARLAMAPPQPEWHHARLFLDSRGFTSQGIPYGNTVVSMGVDVFANKLWIVTGDDRSAVVPLGSGRCVAAVCAHSRSMCCRAS